MNSKLSGWADTIVAPATAPGVSAIGVIRISGPDAFVITDQIFLSKKISDQKTHTLHVGIVGDGSRQLDEVVVSVFKGPKSYTGEDTIEISCHGSMYVQQQIIELIIGKGARYARAGEFTQRAFLNGRLDLTQAEAVADLIVSNTAASQRTALHNIRGGFSHELAQLREKLISFSALIELELDFATEDVEFADRSQFYALTAELKNAVKRLISSFALGNVIKHGVSVAIIGKPNAGKSTLLNTLLKEDRAIVSETAGTTRDTIEEVLNINGVAFRLIDTAGIREHSGDAIESIGIKRSLEKMRSADLVLYIFDSMTETAEDLNIQLEQFNNENIRFIAAANKADNDIAERSGDNTVYISAKLNLGIDELKEKIFNATVHRDILSESNIVTNVRHLDALKKIDEALTGIVSGLDAGIPGDLLSSDIRSALYYLGEITGEVTNEDKLDFIFSKFCIGK